MTLLFQLILTGLLLGKFDIMSYLTYYSILIVCLICDWIWKEML